jgi:hypothetical protein
MNLFLVHHHSDGIGYVPQLEGLGSILRSLTCTAQIAIITKMYVEAIF